MPESQEDFDTAPDHFNEDIKHVGGIFQGFKLFVSEQPNKHELEEMIKSNGGEVLYDEPSQVLPGVYIINDRNITNLPTISPVFIRASVANHSLLRMENYKVEPIHHQPSNSISVPDAAIDTKLSDPSVSIDLNPDVQVSDNASSVASAAIAAATSSSITGSNSNPLDDTSLTKNILGRPNHLPPHNKSSFTEDEDEFILDVVRKNPNRRTTHTLFDEISHFVPNHTGNSIRHRYRVYLSKRLNYVYQTDGNGKLVHDENGNLIKTEILPSGLKKKFTADEDFTLAINVKKQFYRDIFQVDPETGNSLIKDDDEPSTIARRKVLMAGNTNPSQRPTFDDFKVIDRRGPLSREFFKTYAAEHPSHTENAWRDRFRKFLLAYGIDNYIAYYEGEKSAGREPEAMKNMTNRTKRSGPAPGNYNNAKKIKYLSPSVQQTANHFSLPQDDLLDEETLSFISGLKRDLSRMDNSTNTDVAFEYPQELAESIRNDFVSEESQFDNINPDDIPFPPQIATNDLFLPDFFRFPNTRAFLDVVNAIINRDYQPSQAEKLVEDLRDECGVRKAFSTAILTALSGDLMVVPRYFLCAFRFHANPPMNVPGIWTKEDDEMLKGGDSEDIDFLIKKHGNGRIEMRKKFHQSNLV